MKFSRMGVTQSNQLRGSALTFWQRLIMERADESFIYIYIYNKRYRYTAIHALVRTRVTCKYKLIIYEMQQTNCSTRAESGGRFQCSYKHAHAHERTTKMHIERSFYRICTRLVLARRYWTACRISNSNTILIRWSVSTELKRYVPIYYYCMLSYNIIVHIILYSHIGI